MKTQRNTQLVFLNRYVPIITRKTLVDLRREENKQTRLYYYYRLYVYQCREGWMFVTHPNITKDTPYTHKPTHFWAEL